MRISACIKNSFNNHEVEVSTNDDAKRLYVPGKSTGYGSRINGGELLFLSLATCYCNDLYREAEKRGITIHNVNVEVNGEFEKEGEPALSITYQVNVEGDAGEDEIDALIKHTDTVAEIQNTLRKGVEVTLL